MSYYRVVAWKSKPKITTLLKAAHFDNFVGNDNECHLNIPDNLLVHDLHCLTMNFDVMITERGGTKTFWLAPKDTLFQSDESIV